MVPLAVGFAIGSRRSSTLVAKLGTKKVAAGGILIAAVSLVGFSFLDMGTAYWIVGVVLAAFGIGLGTALVPSTDAVLGAVPEAKAGIGSAVNDSARQVGYALGIGVLGSILNGAYSVNIHHQIVQLPREAFNLAHDSVGGATQVATSIGGPAGEALRVAAYAAFLDAFGVAMIVGAAIAFVVSLMVLRFMPAHDLPIAGSEDSRRRANQLEGMTSGQDSVATAHVTVEGN